MSSDTNQRVAIGIDLGTTYSCVSYYENGKKLEAIENENGDKTTPSYVAFNERELRVGKAAKSEAPKNPFNTIYDVKRLIGRKFADPEVQRDIKTWPFKVTDEDGKIKIEAQFNFERQHFLPEQISGFVLAKMKSIAEKKLGRPITDAVVTVPAYFDDAQKEATLLAGKFAGLNILKLITEPSAAALAYGITEKLPDGQHILVFDLGGGTFDVCIMKREGGRFVSKAIGGDAHLGGVDFDNRLIDHMLADFKAKNPKLAKDPATNKQSMHLLRAHCEDAKRQLSGVHDADIVIENFIGASDFNGAITRAKFEELNEDLFRKTIAVVDNTIKSANMDKSEISDVVLVGGSSRIPKIQEMLKEFFGGTKELCFKVNPDEAIALGAAIHASYLIAGQTDADKKEEADSDKPKVADAAGANAGGENAEASLMPIECTPFSLGIEVLHGKMHVLVPRSTQIPKRVKKSYQLQRDNVTAVPISIYQGERPLVRDNKLLGKFSVKVPPARAGAIRIDVTFAVDDNGILRVSALETTGGNENSVDITNDCRFTDEEIEAALAQNLEHMEIDKQNVRCIEAKFELTKYCNTATRTTEESSARLTAAERKEVVDVCTAVRNWMRDNQDADLEVFEKKLRTTAEKCEPLLKKAAG